MLRSEVLSMGRDYHILLQDHPLPKPVTSRGYTIPSLTHLGMIKHFWFAVEWVFHLDEQRKDTFC